MQVGTKNVKAYNYRDACLLAHIPAIQFRKCTCEISKQLGNTSLDRKIYQEFQATNLFKDTGKKNIFPVFLCTCPEFCCLGVEMNIFAVVSENTLLPAKH